MSELTIDLVSAALDIAQAKHGIATKNISSGKVEGKIYQQDFKQLLDKLSTMDNKSLSQELQRLSENWSSVSESYVSSEAGEVKLDQQVADLMLASGNYKVLAESLNKKLGLQMLALTGKGK